MNKIGRFFEEHVEKMILVIVGLVCAWLMITRVILSPNVVGWNDRNLSPSGVDAYVYEQAQDLAEQFNRPPEAVEPYEPRIGDYLAKVGSAISSIDESLWPVVPSEAAARMLAEGVYRLPAIGEVNDVAIGLISAVAYDPIDEVTPQNPYDKAGNEPNDIDLVSVEAKFDVAKLWENFRECFVDDVEPQWADPCLAKPIFAAMQLQRQELNDDGGWSDWQDVPRPKIDQYRELFKITEDIKDLPPGGLKVQMLQFDYKHVQIELLQPQAYQFASAREEWFPPRLHEEYEEFQRKELQEERRQERETAKEQRQQQLDNRRNRRSASDTTGFGATGSGGRAGRGGGAFDSFGGGGTAGGTGSRIRGRSRDSSGTRGDAGIYGEGAGGRSGSSRRRTGRRSTTDPTADAYGLEMEGQGLGLGTGALQRGPRRPTINDVYYKYDEIALTRMTDFAKIKEPLVIWAHDDTVEPEKTYRYRIRLGVFNPVAGTDQLAERDKSRKNEAVLWSGFSETTEPVEIMGRLYFFANNMMREADKTVTVQVSRLALGHWYSHDFPVKQGELVGYAREPEIEEPDRDRRSRSGALRGPSALAGIPGAMMGPGAVGPGVSGSRFGAFGASQDQSNVPESIDYATGAVMVDAVAVSDWLSGRTMRSRRYYDMLYSFDGTNILHMPVGNSNWPTDLKAVFGTISRLEKEPQEPFKAFGTTGSRRSSGQMYDGMEGDMMYEEMYDDMGGQGLY